MLIRDKDGNSETFGATAQLFFLLRGAIIGLVIFLLADPFMQLLGAPMAANSFRCIGISSVLAGLVHRDVMRLQREMRFGSSILFQLVPDLIVTALAWPIAAWCRDYNAFVYFAILQTALSVVVSHLLAERPFRLGWHPAVAKKCFDFGWPLLLNALLMFFALQGDRMVLAQAYTQAELGIYSVAVGLALTPSGIIMGTASQLIVPALAKHQDSPKIFSRHYFVFLCVISAAATTLANALVLTGPVLIDIVYGGKYQLAASVIGVLGFSQAIRLIRVVPTTAALALGDAKNSLISNLFRLVGLPAAMLVAYGNMPFVWIAATCVLGEILALIASVAWVCHRHQIPVFPHFYNLLILVISYSLASMIPCTTIALAIKHLPWILLLSLVSPLFCLAPLLYQRWRIFKNSTKTIQSESDPIHHLHGDSLA